MEKNIGFTITTYDAWRRRFIPLRNEIDGAVFGKICRSQDGKDLREID